jgi:hypothetical protein
MKGFGSGGKGSLVGVCVLLALLAGSCSRPTGLTPSSTVSASQRPAPFQDESGAGTGPDASMEPTKNANESGLPFHDSGDLPAGTLLTVELKSVVPGADAASSGTFTGLLDQAVLVEGKTLLPRGAEVEGRVESAGSSQMKRGRGYLRLTLSSVDFDGRETPLQTSSLFVKNNAADGGKATESLDTGSGRRLTFRLTEPCSVPDAHSLAR